MFSLKYLIRIRLDALSFLKNKRTKKKLDVLGFQF